MALGHDWSAAMRSHPPTDPQTPSVGTNSGAGGGSVSFEQGCPLERKA